MTPTALLVLVVIVLAVAIVGLVVHPSKLFTLRAASYHRILEARAQDLALYGRTIADMSGRHADDLRLSYQRDADQQRAVIQALIGDRDRLVTALLAASGNPQAALTVGRVDQIVGGTVRNDNLRDYLQQFTTPRADSEFTTSDNEPIIPVGLGSSG